MDSRQLTHSCHRPERPIGIILQDIHEHIGVDQDHSLGAPQQPHQIVRLPLDGGTPPCAFETITATATFRVTASGFSNLDAASLIDLEGHLAARSEAQRVTDPLWDRDLTLAGQRMDRSHIKMLRYY